MWSHPVLVLWLRPRFLVSGFDKEERLTEYQHLSEIISRQLWIIYNISFFIPFTYQKNKILRCSLFCFLTESFINSHLDLLNRLNMVVS